ncbi:MAG: hypothetical protein HY873_03750 [Chloroflexi bacterium]|nr:hypothetical protein [Chloroflexota bacterium]
MNEPTQHDGDGLRDRARSWPPRQVQGNHDFVWEVGAGLPVILQDTTAGPSENSTLYVYGLDVIPANDGPE